MARYDFRYKRSRQESPCTSDCKERSAGCHSTCERFKEYDKKRMEEEKDKQWRIANGLYGKGDWNR